MKTKTYAFMSLSIVLVSLSAVPAYAGLSFWGRSVPAAGKRGSAIPVEVPSSISALLREASAATGLDHNLLAAVVFRESAFNSAAVSSRGAQGLMQLMPRTARFLGVTDSFDARQNIFGGAKYLKMMLDQFDGNLDMALAAYNAGSEAVKKRGLSATPEAVAYVAAIRSYYSPGR